MKPSVIARILAVMMQFVAVVTAISNDILESPSDIDVFPNLNKVPPTGFNCTGRAPGYYADDHPLSHCQVFHYCHHDGRIFHFLCPPKTIFNQKFFACDHYFNFDCSTAKNFYSLNENLFKLSVDEDNF